MTLLVGCDADERGLSFEISAVGSAGAGAGAHGNPAGATQGGGGQAQGEAGEAPGGDPGLAEGGEVAAGSNSGGAGSTSTTGGSPSSGGDSAGTGGGVGGSSAGTAGGGGMGGEPFVSPCGDLNDNRVDDCEETLVQNSRFDTALSGWFADGALLTQQWVATDARDHNGSGALSISNGNVIAGGTGNTTLGSGQCLAAWGNQWFEVGARIFIKEGQGGGRAAVNLLAFGHDACQGVLLDGLTPDSAATVGAWQVVSGVVKLPPATRSILVRLVATKPFAQPSLEVLFDDVLVREKN